MDKSQSPPVLVAAGGTGGHLFPAAALAGVLAERGFAVHLATDRRAIRFGETFAEEAVHVVASATIRSRNPVALTQTAAALGLRLVAGLAADRAVAPRGRDRFWRLPERSAHACCGVAGGTYPDPRRQRGRRPRQPAPSAARHRHRHDLSRHLPRRAGFGGQGDAYRQPGPSRGDRGSGHTLQCAFWRAAATDIRRQSRRARHGGYRAGGDCAARRRCAGAPADCSAGAQGGSRPRARRLRKTSRLLRRWRRSFPTCRRASRRAISSWRGPALPRLPNWPQSAGRPSSCRCRMRSTKINLPMPACSTMLAAHFGLSRRLSHPSGWPLKLRRSAGRRDASRPWPLRRDR